MAKLTGFSEVVHGITWLNQRIIQTTTKVRLSALSYLNNCCSAETVKVVMLPSEYTALLGYSLAWTLFDYNFSTIRSTVVATNGELNNYCFLRGNADSGFLFSGHSNLVIYEAVRMGFNSMTPLTQFYFFLTI